ncbi:MAG: VOC family protein [bacterium]|nr:VOC family protein [bacterium]
MKIPDTAKIQSADLRVRDLQTMFEFYTGIIGLKEIERTDDSSFLSANSNYPYLLKLTEDKNAPVRIRGTAGLFHVAYKFHNRKELARVFMRLFDHKVKFQGFSDHIVSEAIYLADPEGNGIELYADRPENEWIWQFGQIQMDTLPLDLSKVTNELDDKDVWKGIHPETFLGHIHLNVSDLNEAERFYNELLGFKISNNLIPGGLFMAAGNYHHHIGANTWMNDKRLKADSNAAGLTGFAISGVDSDYKNELEKFPKGAKIITDNDVLRIRDHDGIEVSLLS